MTKPVTFKQDDVSRAVKGVTAAGLNVARVDVIDGKISVIIGDPDSESEAVPPTSGRSKLDRLIDGEEA